MDPNVKPVIRQLVPDNGPVGTEVTILGTGFGDGKGEGCEVTFNGVPAEQPATAEEGAPAKKTPTRVKASRKFSKEAQKAVRAANKRAAAAEEKLAAQEAEALASADWREDSITVLVPEGATSGDVHVLVNGVLSNGSHFHVTPQGASEVPHEST